MKRILQRIKVLFLNMEFVKFIIVGGINTLNGLWIPTVLSNIMNANIAYVVSYIPSLAISYVLNSLFTFKDKKLTFIKYLKFCLSYAPNFVIQNLIFLLTYNVLALNRYIGIILPSAIGIPVTFVLMKLIVFKKKTEEKN